MEADNPMIASIDAMIERENAMLTRARRYFAQHHNCGTTVTRTIRTDSDTHYTVTCEATPNFDLPPHQVIERNH